MAAKSSSRYLRRFVPGIGTMSSPCAITHARANCAGVHFFSAAIFSTRWTSFQILVEVLTLEARRDPAEIIFGKFVSSLLAL